ncbi:MAG: DUF3604 domain-containing protein [Dehalococcoidia bacterium]
MKTASIVLILAILSTILLLLMACDGDGATSPSPKPSQTKTAEPTLSPEPEPEKLVTYTENREPCDCRSENKNLYWGELHAHTTLSYDAYVWGTMTTPEQAYEFAKGGTIALTAPGTDRVRQVSLSRPLDFAALTDHQEYLAETYLCTDEDSGAYNSQLCQQFREGGGKALMPFSLNLRNVPPSHIEEICQSPGVDCREISKDIWEAIVQNAEDAYDRTSDCSFTAFPAYEFTLSPHLSNKHRNIIFRNAEIPELPPSSFEQSDEQGFWAELAGTCLDKENDCDFIAIPHNSNWSNGNMFMLDYPEGLSLEDQREMAAFRARMEPLVEIAQHKGSMECRNGFEGIPDDPLCDYEKLRAEDAEECIEPGKGGMAGAGCISRYDYIRNVLKLGLSEWLRLGVNPYKLGIIGGTDTHNGTPGKTEEYDYPGHWGSNDNTPEKRLTYNPPLPSMSLYNPGALTAIWAVENSRDALFESLRNRETYATTGPRISVRFFGGWDFPAGLCEADDFVSVAYDKGIPMGGDLPVKPESATAPTFAVVAEKDPGVKGHPGNDLQQIQIIKGWIDQEGNERERIFTVAGDPDNEATVDPETCEPIGEGWERLCAVWPDPEFDPSLPAFYYVRVVENPSCRWTQYDCNKFSEDDMPEVCTNPAVKKVVQQRAITSPIWYEPAK